MSTHSPALKLLTGTSEISVFSIHNCAVNSQSSGFNGAINLTLFKIEPLKSAISSPASLIAQLISRGKPKVSVASE